MGIKTVDVPEKVTYCDYCGEDFSKYSSNFVAWSGYVGLEPEKKIYSVFGFRVVVNGSGNKRTPHRYTLHHACAYSILDSYFQNAPKDKL